MDRRSYLLGSVAVGGSILTAGCSGVVNSLGESDEEKAREHIDSASEALGKAGDELESQSDKFEESELDQGGVDVQITAINGYLDTASDELDEASEYATEDQQRIIDAARGYVGLVRETAEFLDVLADGYSEAAKGFTYIESDRYTDAVDQLGTAEETLNSADEALTRTQDQLDSLNRDPLSDLERVEFDSLEEDLQKLEAMVPALIELVSGMRALSRALIDFQDGTDALDTEDYATAQTKYESARDHFSTASSTFKDQESDAPTELQNTFVELTCYAGALRDASDHFANAAEALQNGNESRANTEAEKGKEASNRCGFDSS